MLVSSEDSSGQVRNVFRGGTLTTTVFSGSFLWIVSHGALLASPTRVEFSSKL
ncbi:MAG: hypothetical protein QXN79_06200 [Zestosphaera sp.]